MNSDAIQIRPADVSDARAIAELHVESWRAAYAGLMPQEWLDQLSVDDREKQRWEELTGGRVMSLVALTRETLIGWIAFGPSRDEGASAAHGEVYALYLTPGEWRRGVGRRLWRAATDELRNRGRSHAVVWVLERNERACRFYERMGAARTDAPKKTVGRDGVELAEVQYAIELR